MQLSLRQMIGQLQPVGLARWRGRRHQLRAGADKAYPTYAAALAAAGGRGYNDPTLSEAMIARVAAVTDFFSVLSPHTTAHTLLAVSMAATRAPGSHVQVLDFGGGAGFSGRLAQQAGLSVHWAVVDTPAQVRACRRFETDNLRFFESISEASQWLGTPDLVYTSGAVQYTPDPADAVAKLAALNAPVFAHLRCAWSDADKIIHVQWSRLSDNGTGRLESGEVDRRVGYPRTFIPRTEASRVCTEAGYRQLVHFADVADHQKIAGVPVTTGEAALWVRP